MKTPTMWRLAALWLRRENAANTNGCGIAGCRQRPTVAVAATDRETTFLCAPHAVAWSESALCREVAQADGRAALSALSVWLDAGEVARA